ncbi:LapA family protein [Tepidamorphus sp. 3E244]|uniref:LapA family protein n=1 Tax=Tepidamorphus sp. 3E244 TaxID=3385498 RepID=UPI0038FCC72C
MLRKLFSLLILLPLAILLVAFTVANRHMVKVALDPFSPANPAIGYELPLYAVIFASLCVGVIAGGMATWFGQGRWRKEARDKRTEAARARREAESLRRDADRHDALPAPRPQG